MTQAEQAASIHARHSNPAGSFDNAGRWYPDSPCACCGAIRPPSRAWPYSYLTHCRTIAHLARQYGIPAAEIRAAVKALRTPQAETPQGAAQAA